MLCKTSQFSYDATVAFAWKWENERLYTQNNENYNILIY